VNASESLILVDHSGQSATATDKARELIEEALAVGALIGAVRNGHENEQAAEAQRTVKGVKNKIEEAYRAAKDPIVKTGKMLDLTYHGLIDDLEREYARLGVLAGQFAIAEKRRIAAEELLAKEKLANLESEKLAALAKTTDPVEQSKILEDSSRKAAMMPLPSAPARAQGQKVRDDWEVSVVNVIDTARWALMTGRWEVLDIGIRKGPIKDILRGGMKEIPGLKCTPTIHASVQLPRSQKLIDV
jgi:hypothetical protein